MVPRMRMYRRFRNEHPPVCFGSVELSSSVPEVGCLDHGTSRSVALEVVRVELDPLYHPATREADDRPVVSGPAPAFRLPSVTHVGRAAGKDQILPMTVVHVAALDDESAVLHRC